MIQNLLLFLHVFPRLHTLKPKLEIQRGPFKLTAVVLCVSMAPKPCFSLRGDAHSGGGNGL